MLEILKKLFRPAGDQPQLDPRAGWKEVPAESEVIDVKVPAMEGAPGSLTDRQKTFLESLDFPAPEQLNYRQAGLVLSCMQYVRHLYADNLKRNLSQCPTSLCLRMLPLMLGRPDICEYVTKWDESMMRRDDSQNTPFARRKKNPLHLEIQREFNAAFLRS